MKQSGTKFRFSQAETAKVTKVQFGLMSNEEIEHWTIDEITGIEENNIMEEKGLCDKRLGVNSNQETCKMCKESVECPGHFGRIKLAKAVYHMGYLDTVSKVLKCICLNCSKLRKALNDQDQELINKMKNQKSLSQKKKLSEMAKILGKQKKCIDKVGDDNTFGGCGVNLPDNIREGRDKDFLKLFIKYKKKENSKEGIIQQDKEETLMAEECFKILDKISMKDAEILGFTKQAKPKDLIINNLLVCPPQVRPTIEMNSTQRSHDDITNVYRKIIKLNKEILDNQNVVNIDKKVQNLESIIARMMDNDKESVPALQVGTAKKPVKSIKQRLKGKEGRFRQHLMGKRVDFSARSVVSPDACLALDELGVPQYIADNITIPEEVTMHNLKKIIELCRQGKVKTLISPSQDKQQYDYWDNNAQRDIEKELNYGVVVERSLQNGDFVLFNRQPTLHKMSMMGHRVKILPYSTFRLNLSVTTPYNADFDGDEMNMHVPQGYETRAELKHICYVPRQVVTPKSNKPVMGIVQDSLIGISLFTLKDTFLTKEQVMNLIMWIDDWEGELPMPAIMKPEALWTGKQIVSLIIPKKITMQRGNDVFSMNDNTVYILRGELLQGIMMKEIVGDGAGGLVHTIWLDIGAEATCNFMTRAQRVINSWLIIRGFTMSCSDIVPNQKAQKEIADLINQAEKRYEEEFDLFQDEKKIEQDNLHKVGKKILDSFEVSVNAILNKKISEAEKKIKDNTSFIHNNMMKMVWAGSKGKPTNLAQVMGLVGQQNIEGARIRLGFNRRTLPHFNKDNYGLKERGFVKANFFHGLQPYEFFFHTMGGREGLSDTAVKTSRTGYIQRKLIKALEDVMIRYDGTVRDSTGRIIQFSYGEDGLAGEFIERIGIKAIEMDNRQLEKEYQFLNLENLEWNLSGVNEFQQLTIVNSLSQMFYFFKITL